MENDPILLKFYQIEGSLCPRHEVRMVPLFRAMRACLWKFPKAGGNKEDKTSLHGVVRGIHPCVALRRACTRLNL